MMLWGRRPQTCSLHSQHCGLSTQPHLHRGRHAQSSARRVVRCAAEAAEAAAPASSSAESESLGPDLWNTTYYPKGAHADTNIKNWYVIDAANQRLGRLATHAANHIRGKQNQTFTPSMDMGGYVVVINAEKVTIGGRKYTDKMYYRVTGRPGAMKTESFAHLQQRIPERILEHAIKGMLPKGRLGRRLFTHLKVYKGPNHPHSAQRPQDITERIDAKPALN
ncbi:hypothetical protein WJX73_007580 [Symbiochloris irregularis]|uniref:50S ribosomal protein L13, chloroplastic n=1 Tax=Symbiochloris irregularis TaxID=706552 RepID=A0AAW1NX34_9CHLO